MRRFSLIISALLILAGCKDDPVEKTDFGYDYLPLSIGHWVEYEVDSIVFDPFTATVDTFSFLLREEIVETFTDLEDREQYRVEQSYIEGTEVDPSYAFRKSYSIIIDGVRAERLEDNLKTVPLVFPPREGATWDGNAFNTHDQENYTFDFVDASTSIGQVNVDSSARIIQVNDTNNFVIKEYSEEQYARHVGLIYKEYFDIETQFDIDSGLHWIQRIIQSSAWPVTANN